MTPVLGISWSLLPGVKRALVDRENRVKLINPVSISGIERHDSFSQLNMVNGNQYSFRGKRCEETRCPFWHPQPIAKAISLISSGNSGLWKV